MNSKAQHGQELGGEVARDRLLREVAHALDASMRRDSMQAPHRWRQGLTSALRLLWYCILEPLVVALTSAVILGGLALLALRLAGLL